MIVSDRACPHVEDDIRSAWFFLRQVEGDVPMNFLDFESHRWD